MKLSCYVCIRSVVVFPSRAGTQHENMSLTSYPSGDTTVTTALSTCSLSNGNMIAYTLHYTDNTETLTLRSLIIIAILPLLYIPSKMSNTYFNCFKGCLFEGTWAAVHGAASSLNIVASWLVLGLGMMDGLSRDHLSSLAPWSITDKVIGKYFSLQMFPRLGQRQAYSLTVQQRVCCEDNMPVGLTANYIIRY